MQEEPPEESSAQPVNSITWTASEYIAHQKTAQWYVKLGVSAIVLAFLVWLITKDKISAAVVMIGAAVLGGYGARPPRELQYQLDFDSLTIGNKPYPLDAFKSFSIDDNQAFSSVNLIPLKRFAPGLTIYYSLDDEEQIVNILSKRLPLEEHRADPIDTLMHRIRF